ncbi:DUF541 domain-containing protein [Amycolatopsis rhizosphaerae]|uniref:DUF541 domain-containing protein n=1 Tax=Amycolatopsis rhizosphaerae TaxID=2053003 RepID=A0A558CVH1_9PSEU|nr:SIMPL domain-containing protein [Amycolatopsis rhizosphaerae]TVT52774.1 DUF541 domain-containing protein [Amycolatopsis rhizosphaerae]
MAEVETQGSGQVERIADRALFRVVYTERAKDRAGAVTTLTKRIGPVESLLAGDGVQVRDRRLSVHDTWDVKRRSGAQADQSYLIRITDLAVLDDLVAGLVRTEPASLAGPSWELADRDDAMRQAQREAVAEARRRAEGYANALGRGLGPLLRLRDGLATGQPAPFGANRMPAPAGGAPRPDIAELSLEPQWVTVAATCTTTWELPD